MADLYHYFPINVAIEKVFEGISTPKGLDLWWCENTQGTPEIGAMYLSILKRNLEFDEEVPYASRL